MIPERRELETCVIQLVAEALDRPLAEIHPHSSLLDDLGAESIDFLDILFRVETTFGVKISEQEMWKGSIGGNDPDSIRRAVDTLRERMPDFRWDRLPERLTQNDLPRLITVRTIIDYLDGRRSDPAVPEPHHG